MFDVSNPNEEFREIKIIMNSFYENKQARAEEKKKLKEALQVAELKTEQKLRIDDIEGYSTSKNEEAFYRKKIKTLDEMKPAKIDLFQLRNLIKEEREKVITEFDEGKECLEKAFMKALIDLCDFMEDKKKKHKTLERLVDSLNMKDDVGVSPIFFEYLDDVRVSYYNGRINLEKGIPHAGISSILFKKEGI